MKSELEKACERLVANEVRACISSLVWDLTQGKGAPLAESDEAIELWTGPIDLDEAAQSEWSQMSDAEAIEVRDALGLDDEPVDLHDPELQRQIFESRKTDIEDYRREVFEHWIVTHRFAEKLREAGESVVDWHGVEVWCRTTTGQAIALDYVIQTIAERYYMPARA